MKIEFFKYQGTGNDFVILDNRDNKYSLLSEEQIKKICTRSKGVGADGLMLLNNNYSYDFEMKYFNADGKESSMCGNGGRCIIKFASFLGISKKTYQFKAIDGDHLAVIDDFGSVRLKMKDIKEVEIHSNYFLVDTGSPHYVEYVDDLELFDVYKKGHDIRNSVDFKQKGINVNFVEINSPGNIFVRTYERGVENETLSCGTGVTAAAIVSAPNSNGFNKVKVKTKGGPLLVEFEKLNEQQYENIWLCGPAEFVFSGSLNVI